MRKYERAFLTLPFPLPPSSIQSNPFSGTEMGDRDGDFNKSSVLTDPLWQ